jgi:hypothetical protein
MLRSFTFPVFKRWMAFEEKKIFFVRFLIKLVFNFHSSTFFLFKVMLYLDSDIIYKHYEDETL